MGKKHVINHPCLGIVNIPPINMVMTGGWLYFIVLPTLYDIQFSTLFADGFEIVSLPHIFTLSTTIALTSGNLCSMPVVCPNSGLVHQEFPATQPGVLPALLLLQTSRADFKADVDARSM